MTPFIWKQILLQLQMSFQMWSQALFTSSCSQKFCFIMKGSAWSVTESLWRYFSCTCFVSRGKKITASINRCLKRPASGWIRSSGQSCASAWGRLCSFPVHNSSSIVIWLDEYNVEELDWPTQTTTISNTFEMNQHENCKPGPFVQHQHLTSRMFF